MQTHRFFKVVFLGFGVLILFLLIGFQVSQAWAPPTVAPPGGNVPTPLNVGTSNQAKTGGTLEVQGFWVHGADTLIDGDLGIGLGAALPNTILDILGAFSIRGIAAPVVSPAGQGRIYFDSTANKFRVSQSGGGYTDLIGAGGSLPVGTSGQTLRHDGASWVANSLLFNNGTNVGIGTTTPGSKLSVNGLIESLASGFKFPDGTTQTTAAGAGSGLWVASGANISNTNTGNVGIGTAGPARKLDVRGGIDSVDGQPGFRYIDTRTALSTGNFSDALVVDSDEASLGVRTRVMEIRSIVEDAAGTNWGLGLFTATGAAATEKVRITNAGNVGIGTATPAFKLDVNGTANISGKLTVTTIDPVYEIDGKKYATYVADVAGGVKTEVTGVLTITNGSNIIDFDEQKVGSDLWLFWQTSSKNVQEIAVLLTPSFEGKVWYEKEPNKNQIIIKASQDGEVSFRLTAPREDAAQWPNEITE